MHGHNTTIHHAYQDQNFPAQNQFDWLIVLGGPMNVDEEEKHPWLRTEKKFIEQTLAANKSYLGICLGGQLLAQVLGAKVTKNKFQEIGWHDVIRNQNQHAAFAWPTKATVFQWHEDRFDLPSGAIALATSEATEFQAYGYGKNVIGLQFHPESTADWILTSYKDLDESKHQDSPFVQSFVHVEKKTGIHLPEMTENFFKFLDNMEKNR